MRILVGWLWVLGSAWTSGAWAAHGYALWGDLKYPAGFVQFDYANGNAPKGGELRLVSNLRVSTFDKYNPFTIKGTAPAYLSGLMFDTLLIGSLDETAAAYGLLAEDVSVAADGLSANLMLEPEHQAILVAQRPEAYQAVLGGWGKQGATTVVLAALDVDELAVALQIAHGLAQPAPKVARRAKKAVSSAKPERRATKTPRRPA